LSEDRADVAEADEDGGGGDDEFSSAGEPLSARNAGKIATVSQHTELMKDLEKKDSLIEATSGISALVARINEMCGGTTLLASAVKPQLTALGVALGRSSINEAIAAQSKWSVETISPVTVAISALPKNTTEPQLSVLAALENKTSLLAHDNGIAKITSVTTQISSITGILASQTDYIKELIAPKTMLTDLQTIATQAHKAIEASGQLSAWQLGVIDTASLMVDRQVNWASKICSAEFSVIPLPKIDDVVEVKPRLNVIALLPEDLKREKEKKENITPEEALVKSTAFRMSEKGKRIIDKVVAINKICERKGRERFFKYTGATMRAAAAIGGTVCQTEETFGSIIDDLYEVFYENLERIKKVVTDDVVRKEDVYQCIFHVKNMRTDLRHDYEHGKEKDIRNKDMAIGDSYKHYAGKPVLITSSDYLTTQDKLYDEFDELTDRLLAVVEAFA
jgi:hypothetical protein